MESVLRHCYVMNPKEFSKASSEGDDVFLSEYEYDVRWHSFKRIADLDDEENDGEADNDEDWDSSKDSGCDTEEDFEYKKETEIGSSAAKYPANKYQSHELAADSRKGHIFGLQKIGTENSRIYDREMEEMTAFVKGAICKDNCLGRCLYIHGVPVTGKTMSVLAVMKNLRSEVDAGSIRPCCFVEINGLKLASPENIYRVIYEALSGHRVGWKKALHLLNERFSDVNRVGKDENQPCVLLIDELDLLVTRNQSVLYNILDWPTKPHSKLIVIGIANTMDLPEKLLPRISSRMGIQRLCFGPYNHQQLQEIISSRLKGINAFEKQAIEFASRKVAAISGDAHRALEICRRAAELADYRHKQSPQSTMPSLADHDSQAGT
ncbi:origin of replication complex subunit 1-like [Magnolia sinica]|uniref:origin of replication complex subunit 1-like n=1 Tax=Magnolia sinica TaxID=86752 RepID=UPI00265967FE|nr:origin of replication complex subunit 1-like [Magnolia sinica]